MISWQVTLKTNSRQNFQTNDVVLQVIQNRKKTSTTRREKRKEKESAGTRCGTKQINSQGKVKDNIYLEGLMRDRCEKYGEMEQGKSNQNLTEGNKGLLSTCLLICTCETLVAAEMLFQFLSTQVRLKYLDVLLLGPFY